MIVSSCITKSILCVILLFICCKYTLCQRNYKPITVSLDDKTYQVSHSLFHEDIIFSNVTHEVKHIKLEFNGLLTSRKHSNKKSRTSGNDIDDDTVDILSDAALKIILRYNNLPKSNSEVDHYLNYEYFKDQFSKLIENNEVIKGLNYYADHTKYIKQTITEKLLDALLEVGKQLVAKSVNGYIPIPNISKDINWHTSFQTTGGLFGDLSTVYKTRNYEIENDVINKTYKLTSFYGLEMTNIMYHYKAKSYLLKVDGDVVVDVEDATANITFLIDYATNPCVLTVTPHISFNKLNINLTGFGYLNGVVAVLAKSALKSQRETILYQLNNESNNFIKRFVEKINCETVKKVVL